MDPTTCSALLDELSKIAAARARMTVPQSRKGRRPMRVATMLRKEKEGSLYKTQFPDLDGIGKQPSTETRQTNATMTALAPRIGED